MSDMTYISRIRAGTSLLALSFALTGCLSEEVATENEAIEQRTTLTGSVGDGPLVGATVTISASDGTELGSIQSDSVAEYSISVMAVAADYPLTIEALGGTDLVTGQAPDFVLRSTVTNSVSQTVANANPFSTVIYDVAELLPGGLSDANVDTAGQIVWSELNSGLSTIGTRELVNGVIDAGNIAEIVRASESLSEVVRRTRDLQRQFGVGADGDRVIGSIAADLTDDVIDGRGAPATDARTAALSTVVSAQVLLETIANELHVNGIDATAAMRDATESVSAATPQPGIDDLVASDAALERIRIGLAASYAVTQDPAIAELHASVSGVQPGMSASFVRNLLPADYNTRLDSALITVASGNAAVLEAVNDIARTRTGTIAVSSNNPPTITGDPQTSVEAGSAYAFTPQASDADGDALTFDISGMPGWASFDAASGSLSGTPGVADAGNYENIVISVTDGEATASLPSFAIDVFTQNRAPVISGTPQTQVTVGEAYSFTPDASDADGDALTLSVENAPAWASFSMSTGELSGTPAGGDVGTYADIRITVSDGSLSDSLTFSIDVTAGNAPPVISGTPAGSVQEGQAYSFTPTASDPDGDPLSFSINNRPGWASFDSLTGSLTGTPQDGDAGVYSNIRITVTDGALSDTLAFSIEVTAVNTAPQISGNPPALAVVGQAYAFQPTASDADGDALTFSVAGLPSWADFDTATGALSGTPAAGDEGLWSGISITVSDGTDSATLGPFSIDVSAASLGSATLTWVAPTQNEDGSPLTDLAGYRIYWGTTPGSYPNSVTINNSSISTYVVENLAPGTYEFVATSFNSAGVESAMSNPATKVIP